jgi:hypothetical protein
MERPAGVRTEGAHEVGEEKKPGGEVESDASRWKESANGFRRAMAAARLARSADHRETSARTRSQGRSDQRLILVRMDRELRWRRPYFR